MDETILIDKDLLEAIYLHAYALSKDICDEREFHHTLFEDRAKFINEEISIEADKLVKEHIESKKIFIQAAEIIKKSLDVLPEKQRVPFQEEFNHFLKIISSMNTDPDFWKERMDLLSAQTFQELVSLSNEIMHWMYNIGYELFEKNNPEEAYSIFHFLCFINGFIPEYWIAKGFCQIALQREQVAIGSFSIAALINPNSAPARYQLAKLYYQIDDYTSALQELEALNEIILNEKLQEIEEDCIKLRKQIEDKLQGKGI